MHGRPWFPNRKDYYEWKRKNEEAIQKQADSKTNEGEELASVVMEDKPDGDQEIADTKTGDNKTDGDARAQKMTNDDENKELKDSVDAPNPVIDPKEAKDVGLSAVIVNEDDKGEILCIVPRQKIIGQYVSVLVTSIFSSPFFSVINIFLQSLIVLLTVFFLFV